MKIIPEAKMVDIKILEVPFSWAEYVPVGELVSSKNRGEIRLVHVPSGTLYTVPVPAFVGSAVEATKMRAMAKLRFIHELQGEGWLNK